MQTLVDFVRHHCDSLGAKQQRERVQLSTLAKKVQTGNLKKLQQEIKGPSLPSLAIVQSETTVGYELHQQEFGLATLLLHEDVPIELQATYKINSQEIVTIDIRDRQLCVVIVDADTPLPPTGNLTLATFHQDPQTIATHLTTFWNSYWQRDEHICQDQRPDSIARWEVEPQPEIEVSSNNVDGILASIAHTKNSTARGVDGSFPDELKALPKSVIGVLVELFHSHRSQGFNAADMHLVTLPIAKTQTAQSPKQIRFNEPPV